MPSVAELIMARRAARDYRAAARQLEEMLEEHAVVLRNMDDTKEVIREYARIARGAAIAEELDPRPQGLAS